jgi:FkbM family methyltransferase
MQLQSYSQLGQDLWVIELLEGKTNGVFIEVGASNGVYLSNTLLLEQEFAWEGLCIEPSSEFLNLKNNRTCQVANELIFDKDNIEVDFIEDNLNDDTKSFSGIKTSLDKHAVKGPSFKRKTITLNTLLNSISFSKRIDFLSIDTEGSEYEVLQGIDFEKYHFSLIAIEHNWVEPKRTLVRKFLYDKGYHLDALSDSQFDDWYIHSSLITQTKNIYFEKANAFRKGIINRVSKIAKIEEQEVLINQLHSQLEAKELIIQSQLKKEAKFDHDLEKKIEQIQMKEGLIEELIHTNLILRGRIKPENDYRTLQYELEAKEKVIQELIVANKEFMKAREKNPIFRRRIEPENDYGILQYELEAKEKVIQELIIANKELVKSREEIGRVKSEYDDSSFEYELEKKEKVIQELIAANKELLKSKEDIVQSFTWKILSKLNVIPYFLLVKLRGISRRFTKKKEPQIIIKQELLKDVDKEEQIQSTVSLKQKEKGEDEIYPLPKTNFKIQAKYKKGLGALAIPCILKEKESIIHNFDLWDTKVFQPYANILDKEEKIPIVIIVNSAYSAEFERDIKNAFYATKKLHKQFKSIDFYFCNLTGDDDIYETDYSKKVSHKGYKSGPNNQFFLSMNILSNYGDYAFLMEADCYPVKTNWLAALSAKIDNGAPFWIMGSIYRGISDLDEKFKTHLNGNAIYAVGNEKFQEFMFKEIRPFLINIIEEEFPWLAYDCAIDYYFHKAISYKDKSKWNKLQATYHRFHATDFIQNHAGFVEANQKSGVKLTDILKDNPETYVLHGRHLKNEIITNILGLETAMN